MERLISGYHQDGAGDWAAEQGGRLRFAAPTTPTIDIELKAGSTQAIPPEVLHEVEPLGAVRCSVEFFAVDRGGQVGTEESQCDEPVAEGGDPACWAGSLCPECDAVVAGEVHLPGCPATGAIA